MNTIPPLVYGLEAAAKKYSRVVVDTSGLAFADPTFLSLLLRIRRATELRVAGPTPQLRRLGHGCAPVGFGWGAPLPRVVGSPPVYATAAVPAG
ncbi:STAS domain-containing protein [Streptomyces sp. HUCO-GS316]|uniref:STAS domain-containing protein n=1 Tax=Streptomyces sp. HUCO-GS316 TaxID=2692198 RepID=UPI00136866EE|nr:STAS domain-containing protein [Streptomyces sp. HUCO-GS316]MXM66154.1 STAS domain-containing protein [Streptomyces sp. HUCO-GS316]